MNELFRRFSHRVSDITGTPWAFVVSVLVIVVWASTGHMFQYSDTWQLVINTGTTIVTFLMVFLIQNTQNRDSKAIHLKLDELIRSLEGARNSMVDLENCTDEELARLQEAFARLREQNQSDLRTMGDLKEGLDKTLTSVNGGHSSDHG
jgi:low affinity Fe/Cu permease